MASLALVAAFGSTASTTGAIVGNLALAIGGSLIDQRYLFPLLTGGPKDGARVDDWPIGQSFEGAPAGEVDGIARIEGVPIYLGEPIESTVGVGGGKAGPDSTAYVYKRDVVIAFSVNVPGNGGVISELWINGDLVFQLSPDTFITSHLLSAEASSTVSGVAEPIYYLRIRSPPNGPNLTSLQIGQQVVVSGFAFAGNNFTTGNGDTAPKLDNVYKDELGNTVAVFKRQSTGLAPPIFQTASAGPTISLTQDLPQLVPGVAESIQLYTGANSQIPDPYIEAALGVGAVPDYRGLVCVRLGGFNMTRYGNGVAQYQAVVQTNQPTNLGEYVGRVMVRAGLPPDLFDTFGMAGNFVGAVQRGPQEASAILGTALQATNNIAAEIDGRMIFRARPVAVDWVLTADEMGAVEYGERVSAAPWPIEDQSERSLPRAVTVQHMDPELEYQTGSPRAFAPPPAAGDEVRVSLRTWAMSRADAAKAAASAVTSSRSNRQAVRFTLPPSRLLVQPGHLVQLPVKSGYPVRALVISRTRGLNGVLAFEAVVEAPEAHLYQPVA